jgi:3-oxosteroid 1-dehydrogenase
MAEVSDRTCDVLIIGSGIGGLTATIAARLAGMKPMLVEKLPEIGGSSAMSGGVLWLPNNALMQREGVADSREDALTYIANFVPEGDPGSTVERREAYVDAVAPLVSLYESQGLPLRRCDGYSDYYDLLPGGNARGRSLEAEVFDANRLGAWKSRFKPQNMPIPAKSSEAAKLMQMGITWTGRKTAAQVALRGLTGKLTGKAVYSSGAALQGRLLEIALKLGCDIHTNAALVSLDQEGGRVTGAQVRFGDRVERVRTAHGVLVSAGGFARNAAMRHQYQHEPTTDAWTHANVGDTGEAISAMADAGAALGYMDESWWVMGFLNDTPGGNQVVPELSKPHIMLVDADGKRFVNEANSYMEVGRATYERNKTAKAIPAWAIMDSRHRKRFVFGFAMPGITPKDWIEKGYMKKDTTLAGLAAQCGVDAAGLQATIDRWNAMSRMGVDEDFAKGRSAYNRYYGDPTQTPNPCMGAIEKGPFYAAPLVPGDVGTCGGAVTDENGQVKRPDGSRIEGLYASGNCTSPLAGPHYIGAGQSIGCSAIFGMLAVQHMGA